MHGEAQKPADKFSGRMLLECGSSNRYKENAGASKCSLSAETRVVIYCTLCARSVETTQDLVREKVAERRDPIHNPMICLHMP